MVSRWIDLEGPANARDLGGIRVEGGVTRRGRVVRADNLAGLSAADRRRLSGISDVVDLRSPSEVATGRSELTDDGATYHHLDVGTRLGAIGTDLEMDQAYLSMLERSAASVIAALQVIASATGGVAFHCAGGKDRTGIVAAALLSVLGASDAAIVADYAMTQDRMPRVLERLRTIPSYADVLDQVSDATTEAVPETMHGFLGLVRTEYGSMTRFLTGIGLSKDVAKALRTRLVAPDDIARPEPSWA